MIHEYPKPEKTKAEDWTLEERWQKELKSLRYSEKRQWCIPIIPTINYAFDKYDICA